MRGTILCGMRITATRGGERGEARILLLHLGGKRTALVVIQWPGVQMSTAWVMAAARGGRITPHLRRIRKLLPVQVTEYLQ